MSCVIPDGVAVGALDAWTAGNVPHVGRPYARGRVALHAIPFLSQDDYDRLLWACDVNFVRGEDSFVRAQWAARPFVWHIYPQAEDAHLRKLDAFVGRYAAEQDMESAAAVQRIVPRLERRWRRRRDWRCLAKGSRPKRSRSSGTAAPGRRSWRHLPELADRTGQGCLR